MPNFAWIIGPLLIASFSLTALSAQEMSPEPEAAMRQAVADFEQLRIKESVAGFDRVVRLSPQSAPYLWQRGIAQYYAGQYKECRAQFESHRTVNADDVENSAFHFLCVARAESPDKAKAALLPVGPDPRPGMKEIYEMFAGRLTPEKVLAAAGSRLDAQFFTRLYAGLYLDSIGKREQGLKLVDEAAGDQYRGGGYMHMAARVYRDLAKRKSAKP